MTLRSPLTPEHLVGQTIAGRFQLLSVLATGGMSWVFRAEQQPMGRVVALKVLDPERCAGLEHAVARQEQEAAVLARLHHPNVAEVYDAGRWEGLSYVALEYVRGPTLAELLEGGALAPARALRLCRQLASALRDVHALGVVHRDLSLHNLVIRDAGTPKEQLKLLDFGLAQVVDRAGELTLGGQILGSAHSIAPELLRGEPTTASADLYAVGVALYTALVGLPPFPVEQPAWVLQRKQDEPAPNLRQARPDLELPACVPLLVQRCLSRDPSKRPADAEELERALRFAERALREPRLWSVEGFEEPTPRPVWPIFVAALLGGLALGAAAMWGALR